MQQNGFIGQKELCGVAYSSPAVCVFHFRFEGVMCLSGVEGGVDTPGADYGDNDLGDI